MAASKDAIKLQWTENKLKKVEAERDEAVASATLLQAKLRESREEGGLLRKQYQIMVTQVKDAEDRTAGEWRGRCDELEKKLATLTRTHEQTCDELESVQELMSLGGDQTRRSDEELQASERRVQQSAQRTSELEDEIERLKAKLLADESLDALMKSRTEELERVNQLLLGSRREAETARQDERTLRVQFEAASAKLEAALQRATRTQTELDASEEAAESARGQADDLARALQNSRRDVTSLRSEQKELRESRDLAQAQLQALHKDLEETRALLVTAQEGVATLEQRVDEERENAVLAAKRAGNQTRELKRELARERKLNEAVASTADILLVPHIDSAKGIASNVSDNKLASKSTPGRPTSSPPTLPSPFLAGSEAATLPVLCDDGNDDDNDDDDDDDEPSPSLSPVSHKALSAPPLASTAPSVARDASFELLQLDEDNKMLLQRVAQLQTQLRKSERQKSVLREHTETLQLEVRDKQRVVQALLVGASSDAPATTAAAPTATHGPATALPSTLTSPAADVDRLRAAKTKSIRASILNAQRKDSSMTLELSLEINQRMQSVLESTILSNIHLKEQIEILGGEIARHHKI